MTNYPPLRRLMIHDGGAQLGRFYGYEYTDDLGGVQVRIWSRLYQSRSRWYDISEDEPVARAWREAEKRLPFDFAWRPCPLTELPDDVMAGEK